MQHQAHFYSVCTRTPNRSSLTLYDVIHYADVISTLGSDVFRSSFQNSSFPYLGQSSCFDQFLHKQSFYSWINTLFLLCLKMSLLLLWHKLHYLSWSFLVFF